MATTTQRTRGPASRRLRFGEFLVVRHAISDTQLLDSLADHWAGGGRLGDVVVRNGYAQRAEVERLADEYHKPDLVRV